MGILDILFDVFDKASSGVESVKQQKMKEMGREVRQYEDKLNKLEKNSHKLSDEKKEKLQGLRQKFDDGADNRARAGIASTASGTGDANALYKGKTVSQWNQEWASIGRLESANLSTYSRSVGLYRHQLNGSIVYIGRAMEYDNGGFRKRLSDYTRASDSARKHTSGQLIYENRRDITTDLLVVGSDAEDAGVARLLEVEFIKMYNPPWNKQNR